MSIQILLLETGESVIADVREALDPGENKSLGYLVDQPYEVRVSMNQRINTEDIDDANLDNSSSVEFRAWAPLSAERTYRFTEDFVRCIYKPHEEVVGQYFEILQKWQAANTKTVHPEKSLTNTSPFIGNESEDPSQALVSESN
jgi:hypothetical protein